MLEFLKHLKNEAHDAIFFLPGDKKDEIHIESALYKNPGESLNNSTMGNTYHVILFKEDNTHDGIYDVDRFDAVFVEPLEYISGLIPQNWYGVMARKTTTSTTFIQKTFDKLKEL